MILKNRIRPILTVASLMAIGMLLLLSGCLKYTLSGASTNAKSIQVDAFFNNTELAAANFGQTVTNRVKDYFLSKTQVCASCLRMVNFRSKAQS